MFEELRKISLHLKPTKSHVENVGKQVKHLNNAQFVKDLEKSTDANLSSRNLSIAVIGSNKSNWTK